ncbi:flagellar biosynthesis anti-sigma factor FlgM [Paraburkholderia hayleyella]|uniref:flagellar biosynthesis anti-sigma factor FlgM n=1 Tax=Paraburkholderia hayleyella TaxID=2152889 RepID=UPI001291B99E|nr:flagellar biosynthesis anti-sigma factor FlgM [Paraburkholderia hayleyella]
MTIDPTSHTPAPASSALTRSPSSETASGTASRQTAPAASLGTARGDARVQLSGLAEELLSLAASGEADIDMAQVESVKQSLKDGTFTADAGKIADGMLGMTRALPQEPPGNT